MTYSKKNFFIKNNIAFLIIVRMNSKRLKNKAKLKINNYSLIEILVKRLLKIFPKEQIYICTANTGRELFLKRISSKYKINFFAGDKNNIFKRIIDLRKKVKFNHFVRITGDNPFTDAEAINKMIYSHVAKNKEYTYTNSLPVGTKAEIISFKALETANDLAIDKNSSEYMTFFFKRKLFKRCNIKFKKIFNFQNNLHITIDTIEDLILARKLLYKQSIFINSNKLITLMNLEKKKFLKKDILPKIKTDEYNVGFKKNIYNTIVK